ncbi:RNase A-like domain-containing protein [Clostridium saccharoperbutylacetonicum]|uniref:RNase A-like domain-containing protein n=1 Tax=Clostridium saccharoperbutylacetonicum TaxID=36745 RepID=UPI0039EA0AF6
MTSIPWGGVGTLLKIGLIKAGEKIIVKQAEKEIIETVDKEIVNKLDKEIVEQLGKDAAKGGGNPKIIRSVGNDILDIMESNGGHTLEKYVSKSNEDLIKRAIQEDVEAATCYTNKSTATKAVQENLRKNADEISKWLNEESSGKKIF